MSFDETLAARVRKGLSRSTGVTERSMFGGVAWMLDGNMFVGIVKDDLMVRVGPDAHDLAVNEPHARIMDFSGRPMKGYVFVAPEGIGTDASLAMWVERGAAFAATLPPKQRKPAKKTRK
jgi:TfoX/Sxy family transcriptional regulator of competence genes